MTNLLKYTPLITLITYYCFLVYKLHNGVREPNGFFFATLAFTILFLGFMLTRYKNIILKTIASCTYMTIAIKSVNTLIRPETYANISLAVFCILQLFLSIISIYAIVKNEALTLPRLTLSKINLLLFTAATTYVSGYVLAFMAKDVNRYNIILTVALFSSMPLVKAISERKSWAMVSQFLISIVLLVPFITYMYVNPLFFKDPVAIPFFLLFSSAAFALFSLVRPERPM